MAAAIRRHYSHHARTRTVAMPDLQLRSLSPGVRAAQRRLEVPNELLRLFTVLGDVPKSGAVERDESGSPQCGSAAQHCDADATEAALSPCRTLKRIRECEKYCAFRLKA